MTQSDIKDSIIIDLPNKAWINAVSEMGKADILYWLRKVDYENDRLKAQLQFREEVCGDLYKRIQELEMELWNI